MPLLLVRTVFLAVTPGLVEKQIPVY